MRAQRLGLHLSKINIFCDTRLEVLEKVLPSSKASLVVIDSLQTLSSDTLPSPAGSVNQIRHCSNALVSLAKRLGISLFFVAHVTKEGTIADPRSLNTLLIRFCTSINCLPESALFGRRKTALEASMRSACSRWMKKVFIR